MKFRHLLGGGTALARTAAALVEDEGSGGRAAAEPEAPPAPAEPEAPAAPAAPAAAEPATPAAPSAPAAPAAPAPAAADEPELTADELVAFEAGAESRNQAIGTVFASEHIEGREAFAADLLAEGLPADRICKMLAKAPKGANADMLAGIRNGTLNPELGAGQEAPVGEQRQGKAVWDRIAEEKGWDKKKK